MGDGKLIIDGKCPDFICSSGKKVILLHGDYWHYLKDKKRNQSLTREQVEQKDMQHYQINGYDCLIIWEHELEDKGFLLEKIKYF